MQFVKDWRCPEPTHEAGIHLDEGVAVCNECGSWCVSYMREDDTLDRIEALLADMNARMERMEDWIMSMKGETK